MANFCLIIQYDGTRYNGWQRQGNTTNTIQEKLENILEHLYGEPVEIHGSGRTDAGVHALRQIANYRIPRMISHYSCNEIMDYFNEYLPQDIRILAVEKAPERFHAQLNPVSKTYVYRMTVSEVPSVFERKYTYHCFKTPDITWMQHAAQSLIGKHDFKNFSTAKKSKSTVRTITDIDIYGDSEEIQITIQADDFLHNMARLIIGTLLEIGNGNRKIEDIDKIFAGKAPVSEPCDPKGLFLQEIEY